MDIIKTFLGILLLICLILNIDFDSIHNFLIEKNLINYKQEENTLLGLSVVDFKGKVKVTQVFDYTPAKDAGIEEGDRILAINGKKIINVKKLKEEIQEIQERKNIKLLLYRVDSCSTFPVEIYPFEIHCK